jgi:hypothetical protein
MGSCGLEYGAIAHDSFNVAVPLRIPVPLATIAR